MSDRRQGNPIQRLPLPALFAVIVVLWVGIRVVFAHGTMDGVTIGIDVVVGALYATVITAITAARRRRLGGTDASLDYARAIRTGKLPAGVETTGWDTEIGRSERRLLRNRWVVRIGGLLPFGLGIWGATEADSRVLGILLATAMVAGWISTEVATPRLLARMERLRASLPAESPRR